MEADPASVELGIEDGDIIDPHDMDPQTVLRFVKSVNGWPGKVIVIGCEPRDGRRLRHRALARGRGRGRDGLSRSSARRSRSCSRVHELSIASAIVATAARHADGNRVTVVRVRVGRLRQVVPDSLQFCFGMVARESLCEGARLELEVIPAVLRCTACAARVGDRGAAVLVSRSAQVAT